MDALNAKVVHHCEELRLRLSPKGKHLLLEPYEQAYERTITKFTNQRQ